MASDISINLKLLTASFDQGIGKVQKQLKSSNQILNSFTGNLAAIGFSKLISGATQAAGAILDFGQASIQAAVDADETQNKFDVIFQGISKEANKMAEELRKAYGLGSTESKELLANTSDLLIGLGSTSKTALETAGSVTKLAADLTSFHNITGGAARVTEIINKAMLGERDGLVALNVKIDEATVKRKIAENASKGLTFATEAEAKAQATYQLIVEQSGNSIGDYARSSQSAANQSKLFDKRTKDLSEAFGKGFLPAIKPAIVEVNKFLESIDQDQVTAFVKDGILILIDGLIAIVPYINPVINGFKGMLAAFNIVQNGITSGFTTIGLVLAGAAKGWILIFQELIGALPSALVPDGWIEGLNEAGTALDETMKGMVEQVSTDSQDMANSLNNIVNPENMISEDKIELLREKLATVKDAVIKADLETQITQAQNQKKADEEAKKARDKANKDALKQQNFRAALFGKSQDSMTAWEKSSGKERAENLKSTLNTMSSLTNSNNKTLFAIGKASAIAIATIDGIAATQKALASAPPPFNFALAAIVGTASALNVANIAASKPPSAGNYADGGFIPGTSFSGDRLTANVNSGEFIANDQQQKNILAIANGEGLGGNNGVAEAINNLAAQPIMVTINGEAVFEAVREEVESGKQLSRN